MGCTSRSNSPSGKHEYPSLKLIDYLEQFTDGRILIIGDVMLDEYLTGTADRISPEAPVPVVRIEKEEHLVGGAGNVARNIVALGGKTTLIGVRGNDAAGKSLQRVLDQDGINAHLLTLDNRSTTIKTRVLARQQQVVRIDREDDSPFLDQETQALLNLAATILPDCSAVVVSDYGKGIVSESFMRGLQGLIKVSARQIPLLVDPKPQNFTFYRGVTLLTPNAKETSESVAMPVKSTQNIVTAGRAMLEKLECRHLVTTLGSRGMAVFEDSENIYHIPTTGRQVFDVTGAGDTVIAALALGLATGVPLVPSCLLANYAAGVVVAQVGAAVATPNQVAEAVATLPKPVISRWE